MGWAVGCCAANRLDGWRDAENLMSIPDRLWRVVKGHWAMAQDRANERFKEDYESDLRVRDRLAELEAQASAYEELAEALRTAPFGSAPAASAQSSQSASSAAGRVPLSAPAVTGGSIDPLQAAYELLQLEPGSSLAGLDQAYQARLAELHPDQYPAGSPTRAALEGRQHALEAAYQRLRDVLNPTETRFERLEF
jgi:hypothetical protein